MSEVQEVTRAEFARIVGVSRAAVTIAANSGRFDEDALAPGKRLRLPAALQQWRANADQRGLGQRDDDELEDLERDDDAAAPTVKPAEGSVAAEKARAYRLRADKLEYENAVARGTLISRDLITRGLQDAAVLIAADIDGLAAEAERLAALPAGDVAAMRAALKDIARALRAGLARRFEKALAGGGDSDDDDTE